MSRLPAGLLASRFSFGFSLLAALAFPFSAQAASPVAKTNPPKAPAGLSLEALLTPEIGGLALSADGSKVFASFATSESGIENVYAFPAAGGKPEALTHAADSPLRVVSAFPADDRLLLQRGRGGDDPQRLVIRERDGSLTELSGNKPSRLKGWSPDGSSFLLETDDRASGSSDTVEIATEGYARKPFFQNTSLYRLAYVSPQRRFLAFAEVISEAIQNLRLQDRETGNKRALRSGEGFMVHIPAGFTADGSAALYLADTGSQLRYLEQVDPVSGTSRPLVHEDGDILDVTLSADGRYAAVRSAAGSRSVLHLYDAKTWGRIALPGLPDELGEIGPVAFSRQGSTLAFVASGTRMPHEVFVFDLRDAEKVAAPIRLLAGNVPVPDPARLAAAEAVSIPGPGDKPVPGLLLRPAGADPKRKVPAVLFVHDGPAGAARAGYEPLWQFLVQRGYAVLAVNHRGSLGWGKELLRGDDQRHGSADLDDVLAGKKMLVASGWVDPKRIAILGEGSHGGYLALAALAYRPAELAAGVDLFGVADWVRILKSVTVASLTYRALSEEFGSPFDPQTSRYLSPVTQAKAIVGPLFLVQGEADARAVPEEAEAIAASLRERKVPVELKVVAGEGGSLTRRADQLAVYGALVDFLDRNLPGGGP